MRGSTTTASGQRLRGAADADRRLDAACLGLVAGREHNPTADENGPAAQARIVSLLHGREERIQRRRAGSWRYRNTNVCSSLDRRGTRLARSIALRCLPRVLPAEHLGALADHRRDHPGIRRPGVPGGPAPARARGHSSGAGRVVQGALLAIVGLVLAFGLSLALGRYDSRRAAVVDDANTIGTTYLRAQTLSEPRAAALWNCSGATRTQPALSASVPTTQKFRQTIAKEDGLQRQLWGLAGNALEGAPQDSAPRLYVETLNEMIDQQTVRVAALDNRIPNAVLALEVFGTAIAFGLLALYTAMHGRGATTVFLAGALVTVLLLVIFDLDRPTRGLIRVPDAPAHRAARVDGAPARRRRAVASRERLPSARRGSRRVRAGSGPRRCGRRSGRRSSARRRRSVARRPAAHRR